MLFFACVQFYLLTCVIRGILPGKLLQNNSGSRQNTGAADMAWPCQGYAPFKPHGSLQEFEWDAPVHFNLAEEVPEALTFSVRGRLGTHGMYTLSGLSCLDVQPFTNPPLQKAHLAITGVHPTAALHANIYSLSVQECLRLWVWGPLTCRRWAKLACSYLVQCN